MACGDMLHPDAADEAIGQIMMLIGSLGVEADNLACSAPDSDPGRRLRQLRQFAEDMVTLALAGEAVVRQSRDATVSTS